MMLRQHHVHSASQQVSSLFSPIRQANYTPTFRGHQAPKAHFASHSHPSLSSSYLALSARTHKHTLPRYASHQLQDEDHCRCRPRPPRRRCERADSRGSARTRLGAVLHAFAPADGSYDRPARLLASPSRLARRRDRRASLLGPPPSRATAQARNSSPRSPTALRCVPSVHVIQHSDL